MVERDLGEALDKIESVPDKRVRLFGIRFSFAQLSLAVALLSSVVGTLYAGFLMYQKVEAVANLDLGEYQLAMDVMDAKVSGMAEKVEEAVEYSRDIKNGLKDDILRIEQQVDRVEDMVRNTEADVRTMIDAAEVRFESKRDQLSASQSADMSALQDRVNANSKDLNDKVSADMRGLRETVSTDMKELEDRLNKKLQRALDNPLAN